MYGIMIGILATLPLAQPKVDAVQFERLIQGAFAEFKDVTAFFEGSLINAEEKGPERLFQGVYSFRADGATLLDTYTRTTDLKSQYSRSISASIFGKLTTRAQIPDQGYSSEVVAGGGPGVLNGSLSFERILYLWYLQTLKDPDDYGYEYEGWEDIDGHSCLRVRLSVIERASWATWRGDRPYIRLWIDMERGGHPLKVEFLNGSNVFLRTDKIKLAKIYVMPDKWVWFPISGETGSYVTPIATGGMNYQKTPIYLETYTLLDGSLRLNQNLPDAYFTVKREGVKFENGGLDKLRADLDKSSKTPSPRIDRDGVKQRLNQLLAKADSQSQRLEASSPARSTWSWSHLAQYAFGTIGLCLLIVVGYWKWRSR